MSFPPPRVEKIATIAIRLEQQPWAFASERAREIDAHWEKLVSGNARHYNGRVLLMHRVTVHARVDGRWLEGSSPVADYKAFLAWRDFGFPDAKIRNVFAMAALKSADGAFLLGEMAAATASPGKIYFPAGTPDPGDLVGEAVDLEGSVLRELAEEAGIVPNDVTLDPGWTVVFQGPRIACMKIVRSMLSAAQLVARVAAFIAAEKHPELVALKPVFSLKDLDEHRMPDFTLTYLRHVLSGEE
jgi:8-oxo-dGTP pyrophosphatase MutT (NUDIX family)